MSSNSFGYGVIGGGGGGGLSDIEIGVTPIVGGITNQVLVVGAGQVQQSELKTINGTSLLGSGDYKIPTNIQVAASDETTPLTTGSNKVTFRMPNAMILTSVRASLTTAQASGNILTIDINQSGTTILSTKLTIDNTEKTSTTAATPAVISNSNLLDDSEMTIDIDQIGDGTATGLKVTLVGTYA